MNHMYIVVAILVAVTVLYNRQSVAEGFTSCCKMFRNKNSCYDRMPVKWEVDPNMHRERKIVINPFAKSSGGRCRSQNSQCASNKCNDWYCK